jgi:hypothetical protein
MALRVGGEKHENKALVFLVFKPPSSPSPATREKEATGSRYRATCVTEQPVSPFLIRHEYL